MTKHRKKKSVSKNESKIVNNKGANKTEKKIINKTTKTRRKSEKEYDVNIITDALNAISLGETLRGAAHKYGVPKSTLYAKLKNKSSINCRKGPRTILSENEESDMVKWILYCGERGFPVSKNQLLDCVEKFISNQKRKTPFKGNRPGKHWYNAFMHRHPNLSKRIAQNLTRTRASVTEEDLRGWFSHVKNYLERKDLLSIDADRIFNLDESSFMLVPKDNSVLTEKGAKSVYQVVGANEKACLTVLFTVAASGNMPPPMILFDVKTVPRRKVLDNIPKGWGVGNTQSGWMTAESFYSYITNVYFKWLTDNHYQFPIILYLDGHSSHLTLPLCQFCQANKIELIALYPNATHIIQPLDVALFHPLKDAYKKVLRQWRIDNNIVDFKKDMFAPVLKLAIESIDVSTIVKNGFKACGLYPFNIDVVNFNVLNKKKKTKLVPDKENTNKINDCDSLNFLKFFESNIIFPDTLDSFKINEYEQYWNGDIKQEELFEAWRKIKKLCDNNEQFSEKTNFNVSENNNQLCESSYSKDILQKRKPRVINVEIIKDKVHILSNIDQQQEVSMNLDVINCTDLENIEFINELYNEHKTDSVIASENEDKMIEENNYNVIIEDKLYLENKFGHQQEELSNINIIDYTDLENIKFIDECGEDGTASVITIIPDNINNDERPLDLTIPNQLDIPSHLAHISKDNVNHKNIRINSNNKVSDGTHLVQNDFSNDFNKSINIITDSSLKISSPLKPVFIVPNFESKNKKKTKKSSVPVSVVDDLLEKLKEKDDEKKLKEQQILVNKEDRKKNKEIKMMENDVKKNFQECKRQFLQRKKDINLEIKNIKKMIKSEAIKETKVLLQGQQKRLFEETEDIDKSLIQLEMEVLRKKMRIKEEK